MILIGPLRTTNGKTSLQKNELAQKQVRQDPKTGQASIIVLKFRFSFECFFLLTRTKVCVHLLHDTRLHGVAQGLQAAHLVPPS